MNRVRTRERGWVRALNSVQCPATRLLCFPHSGGTAANYRAWSSALPADAQLLAVQYPGHADRIAEDAATSIADMAAHIGAELSQLEPARCALFGHSLGALAAYETARVLQDNGNPAQWLFVSGAQAPSRPRGGTMHLVGDDDLWSALRDLGGIAPEIAGDPEMRDLLLPGLRAYIALTETYQPAPDAEPLDCEIRCYHNTDDPLVDATRLAAWAEVGTGSFSLRAWPGGHFQFLADPAELITDLAGALTESTSTR